MAKAGRRHKGKSKFEVEAMFLSPLKNLVCSNDVSVLVENVD